MVALGSINGRATVEYDRLIERLCLSYHVLKTSEPLAIQLQQVQVLL
jgi:hypothetical protein